MKKRLLTRYADLETSFWRALGRLATPRMGIWLLTTLVLLGALWWAAAHMLKVVLYKAVLLTMAAFLGDKIARTVERRNLRPHELLQAAADARDDDRRFQLESLAHGIYYRRALVIGAAMIAAALGS